jgi:hypothetical protein
MYCALMALTGDPSELEGPQRAKRKTPKTNPPDPDAVRSPTQERPNDRRVAKDDRIDEPKQHKAAKDARLAEDERIDSARNAVGGEEEAEEREAEERRKIKADKKLAKQHHVPEGEPHPDDEGMDGATTESTTRRTIKKKTAKRR